MTNTNTVQEMAKTVRSNCQRAVMCQTFAEAGNTPQAVAAFKSDQGAVPNLVRGTMLEAAVFAINRMFDPGKPQRHCLHSVFRLLDHQKILDQVVANGDLAEIQKAKEFWSRLKDDRRLVGLRALRDFHAAHSIPNAFTDEQRPAFNELFGVLDDTIPLVDSLCAGSGITTVSLRTDAEIWRGRANEYWERLNRGKPQPV